MLLQKYLTFRNLFFTAVVLNIIFIFLLFKFENSYLELKEKYEFVEKEKYEFLLELSEFQKYFKKHLFEGKFYGKFNDKLNFPLMSLLYLEHDRFFVTARFIIKEYIKMIHYTYLTFLETNESKYSLNDFVPNLWPTIGKLTSKFGMRIHPIKKSKRFHGGIDVTNVLGTKVISSASGKVVFSGEKGGYGNTIIVDHLNGYKTLYGHLNDLICKLGDKVKKGQIIGLMGSTGLSTGSHLHFEIHFAGEKVDPFQFLK